MKIVTPSGSVLNLDNVLEISFIKEIDSKYYLELSLEKAPDNTVRIEFNTIAEGQVWRNKAIAIIETC